MSEPNSNTIKDPDDWTTGEEPATGAQESYLHTLASEAHEDARSTNCRRRPAAVADLLEEARHPPGFFVPAMSTSVDMTGMST